MDSFVLAGSNDNSAWITLASANLAAAYVWQEHTITDATAYRYWRLTVAKAGTSDKTVYEVQVLGLTGPVPDMPLLSTAAPAIAAPTDARLAALYRDDSGTATLNADIVFEAGRDGGATWTAVTMVDAGDYDGTYRKPIGHADISGQPSGTSMMWRIRTLNGKTVARRPVWHRSASALAQTPRPHVPPLSAAIEVAVERWMACGPSAAAPNARPASHADRPIRRATSPISKCMPISPTRPRYPEMMSSVTAFRPASW